MSGNRWGQKNPPKNTGRVRRRRSESGDYTETCRPDVSGLTAVETNGVEGQTRQVKTQGLCNAGVHLEILGYFQACILSRCYLENAENIRKLFPHLDACEGQFTYMLLGRTMEHFVFLSLLWQTLGKNGENVFC